MGTQINRKVKSFGRKPIVMFPQSVPDPHGYKGKGAATQAAALPHRLQTINYW